jgi:signal transduction histidine kinase
MPILVSLNPCPLVVRWLHPGSAFRERGLLALAALVLLGAGTATGQTVEIHEEALFKLASEDPFALARGADAPRPPRDATGFVPVILPDFWRQGRRSTRGLGWYRFTLPPTPDGASERWGVFFPRVDSNAAVFLNGRWLGEGGSFEPPGDRGWNRPLYFAIPSDALDTNANTLDVLLQTHGGLFSGLDPPQTGPHEILSKRYARLFDLRIGVARASSLIGAVTLGLFAAIWLGKGRDPVYGYFALAASCWTVNSFNYHLQAIPMNYWGWKALTHAALDGFALFFVFSVSRLLELRQPRFERLLWTFGALALFTAAFAPDAWVDPVFRLTHAVSLGLAVYCFAIIVRRRRLLRRSQLSVYLGTGALFLAIVVRDYLLQIGVVSGSQPRLMQLGGPLVFIGFAGALLLRFIAEYRRSENTNVELEARVQQKHSELEQQFARLRDLEEKRAVGAERERIMREMHDGMGAQLVSTLALVEAEQPGDGAVATALREALQEMRLVIDSLDPTLEDIPSILATMRSRLEPRLLRVGLRFDWQVQDLDPAPTLGAGALLDVLRIVQEAVTNVLKHANARVIRVRTANENDSEGLPCCVVEVSDDGRDGAETTPGSGRGLTNMRHRAARLGGTLDVRSEPTGTRVRLCLPLND